MDGRALLIVGLGVGLYLFATRRAAAAATDSGIYDARDAWAQGGMVPGIDYTMLDANDARAAYGTQFLDLWGSGIDSDAGSGIDMTGITYDEMGNVINVAMNWGDGMVWNESLIPQQYLSTIRAAESRYRMPRNLLARLLWQESRFRPDIINGTTRSAAGATGIAQFMPERISGVPESVALDPFRAIPEAAAMLSRLYSRFGQWSYALASYNWGEGNVSAWLKTGRGVKGQKMPLETSNYFTQVLADIGMPVTTA